MNSNGIDGRVQGKRERWWRSAFLIVATVYVSLLLLGLLLQVLGGFAQILLILFLAWLLAFVLSPVVAWLARRHPVSRPMAIGVVYLATLLLSGFILFYAASSIGASLAEMTAEFPLTRARIEGTLREWQEFVAFGRFNPDLIGLYRDVEETVARIGSEVLGDVPSVTVAVLGALVLVVILSLYMLADSARIIERIGRVVPSRYDDEYLILQRTVSQAFGGFLRAQVLLAGVQAALTIVVVVVADLPYAFLIVAVSTLAMLIPFFGPPLALVPPLLATAIFAPDILLFVAPGLLIVQTVLVNYLQPRLMRDALGMHPILVLVGLLLGAQVAGVWGALFGIPVLAVLNVFFTYAVNLRTIEETPAAEMDDMLEAARREAPNATHEELVAMAAERAEAQEREYAASRERDGSDVAAAALAGEDRESELAPEPTAAPEPERAGPA